MEPNTTTEPGVARVLTQAELFNEELQVLLAKYPTVRLAVAHQIQVEELKPVDTPKSDTNE